MNPIDTYREAFQKFVAEGMSYMEAEDQFDKELLSAAVEAELERGDSVQVFCMDPMGNTNACGHETLFDLVVKASFERRNLHDFETQAVPLMMSGWTSEQVNPTNSKDFWRQVQVMSLYWRAPSKRPRKPGRLYRSTNQAFNAMMKSKL
jgi:hypothetical protein